MQNGSLEACDSHRADVSGDSLFRGTSWYYARFRPAYPRELLDAIVAGAGLDGTGRLLDLGCGPGQLSIPLAPHVAEVVALDSEPEMLVELRRLAPPNVRAVEGRAEDVDESWGAFRLATAGRAFHWFDADRVLDRLVAVTPAVALVGDSLSQSEALVELLAVARAVLGEPPRVAAAAVRYEDALARSRFSDVTQLTVEVERTWTVEQLIGFAYSTSFASPHRVGDRRVEFERLLRERLAPRYRERIAVDAFLGMRRR